MREPFRPAHQLKGSQRQESLFNTETAPTLAAVNGIVRVALASTELLDNGGI